MWHLTDDCGWLKEWNKKHQHDAIVNFSVFFFCFIRITFMPIQPNKFDWEKANNSFLLLFYRKLLMLAQQVLLIHCTVTKARLKWFSEYWTKIIQVGYWVTMPLLGHQYVFRLSAYALCSIILVFEILFTCHIKAYLSNT